MKEKLIVFDMDDVMYNLNEKVAAETGIPLKKFTRFDPHTNPDFTEEERKLVLDAYMRPGTYENVEFLEPVIKLINCIYHEFPMFPVHIVSNCSNHGIREVKLPQLLKVLDLPYGRIHLNVIDMKTQNLRKKFPDNMLMVVDDSPYNIELADADYKVMPARPHNQGVLEDGKLKGEAVYRPETPGRLSDFVLRTLWFESHRKKG